MRADELAAWFRGRGRRGPERIGLVLSGGGARADFQLGALRYLYERERIAPRVIAGTSAGSILAAVLAQSADPAEQERSVVRLEALWREMRHSSEMFTPHEWFARLRSRGPEWLAVLQKRQQRQGPLGRTFARVAANRPWPQPRDGQGETGGTLGVVELLTALREVGRARPDLELILRGADREKAMYQPGPLVRRLLDPEVFLPERVAASGVTLRIAVVALESGELRYVTEDGALVDRRDRPLEDGPVDLVDAVRASCAIPAVFPPVALGEETYVDGGIRETLPAEIVMDHLDVDRCYAVVASPPGVPPAGSFRDKDMLSVVLRSTAGIMADEGLRDEVARARRDGAVVIAPEVDLHDVLTVDPGLTAIAVDYGYLRAAEEVEGADQAERTATREAIRLRREIWQLERELFDLPAGDDTPGGTAGMAQAAPSRPEAVSRPTGGPDAGGRPGQETGVPDLSGLAEHKRRLRGLVARIPAHRRPPGAERWWQSFEGHPGPIPAEPEWT